MRPYPYRSSLKLPMSYCLITGASGGIGTEFGDIFAKNGFNLILVARNKKKLETLCTQLTQQYGIQAISFGADLTKEEDIKKLYQFIQTNHLEVECLVNNAGFGDLGPFLERDWNRLRSLLDLNILALVQLTYLFGNDMKRRGSGKILNVASAAAFSGGPYMALYYASKAFVLSFSEALFEELKGNGITVTAVCPGPTSTNFEKNAQMGKSVMFSRFKPANAKDVAQAGYNALMKNKAIVYHGFVTKSFNIASRFLPRSLARKLAQGVNKTEKK